MSRRHAVPLAKFKTDDEELKKKAFEAGRFSLIYEYQNGDLPGPIEVAAHVLGEEPVQGDLRLRRIGSQLYKLFGPELANYHNDEGRYVEAWEHFGCLDDLVQLMAIEDANRP